jgi:hypothetical protein
MGSRCHKSMDLLPSFNTPSVYLAVFISSPHVFLFARLSTLSLETLGLSQSLHITLFLR